MERWRGFGAVAAMIGGAGSVRWRRGYWERWGARIWFGSGVRFGDGGICCRRLGAVRYLWVLGCCVGVRLLGARAMQAVGEWALWGLAGFGLVRLYLAAPAR